MSKQNEMYSAPRSPLSHEVGGSMTQSKVSPPVTDAMKGDLNDHATKPGEIRSVTDKKD